MFKPIRIIDLNHQDYAIFGDFSGNGVISRKFHKLLVRHVRGQLHFRVLFFQIVSPRTLLLVALKDWLCKPD